MKQSILLIMFLGQVHFGFTQQNTTGTIHRYHDKLELSTDIIKAIQKKDFTKLESILSSLVMPYDEYSKIIVPSYRNQELADEYKTYPYKILPNAILSKDSTIYNKHARNFYFGELLNSILNDADNNYLSKNFYSTFKKSADIYSKNVVSDNLEIIFETKNYIKQITIEELITYNNTLYCIHNCDYETIDKATIKYKSMLGAPFNESIYKLGSNKLISFTNEYLEFENINVNDNGYEESTITNIEEATPAIAALEVKEEKEPEIWDRADVMPQFPGGVAKLMEFLRNNLRYPNIAAENGLEGKVIVKFIVDVDGSVIEPIIVKDAVGGGAADEAIRLIKSMPKWAPGLQRGKPVKTYYSLPVTFRL